MELDRHIPRASLIHGYDPRLKLLLAFAAIVAITLLPSGSFAALGIALLALVAASWLARLGPLRLIRGSWVALPFALLALPLVFTRPGEALATVELGPISLTISEQGLVEATTILLKSWLSVQVALLLTYTTAFPRLIEALRALRVPAVMASIIAFMYRYLSVIGEEAGRMGRARAARSAEGERGGSVAWRARVTGAMVGSLFIRSLERSERVYAAMLARGFDGTARGQDMTRPDAAALVRFGALLAGITGFVIAATWWGAST